MIPNNPLQLEAATVVDLEPPVRSPATDEHRRIFAPLRKTHRDLERPPYFLPTGTVEATSWYDTAPLRSTLENLVDFDRINSNGMRFSVGAVNIRTGNLTQFDSTTHNIRPEHVLASGALPPGFPPVE